VPIWRPPGRSRERILAYGSTGVGKTYAAATIIVKALGPDDTAFIIDADNTWSRTLETDGQTLGLKVREEWIWDEFKNKFVRDEEYEEADGNIVLYHSHGGGYLAHEAAVGIAFDRAERDDWVIIDSMTWLWDDILPWYIKKVYGEDLPDFMIQARIEDVKAGKTSAAQGATAGQDRTVIDWNFINPRWNKHIAGRIVNAKCHVWLTAEEKPIRTDGRVDNQVRMLYEQIGFVPSSQKRLGHQQQTVLNFSVTKTGTFQVTTVKDRGRDKMVKEPWSDLFTGYLKAKGGWRPKAPTAASKGA
jgi:hypothetical protein